MPVASSVPIGTSGPPSLTMNRSKPRPRKTRKDTNSTITTIVRRRLDACCSYRFMNRTQVQVSGLTRTTSAESRAPSAWHGSFERQVHVRDRPLRFIGDLEQFGRREAEHPGEDVGREGLLRDVEAGRDVVVELPCDLDLVLGGR